MNNLLKYFGLLFGSIIIVFIFAFFCKHLYYTSRDISDDFFPVKECKQNYKQTSNKQTNKEQTDKEQTDKEQTDKEQTDKEQTDKEQTDKEQTSNDTQDDINAFSGYLVSFVSVLATFIVLANFVNVKELSNAKDEAVEARKKAVKAYAEVKFLKDETSKMLDSMHTIRRGIIQHEYDVNSSLKKQKSMADSQRQDLKDKGDQIKEMASQIIALQTITHDLSPEIEKWKKYYDENHDDVQKAPSITGDKSNENFQEQVQPIESELNNINDIEKNNKPNNEK